MAVESFVKLSTFDPCNVENSRFNAKAYIDANHLHPAVEVVDSTALEYERYIAASMKLYLRHEPIVVLLLKLLTTLRKCQQRFIDTTLFLVWLR